MSLRAFEHHRNGVLASGEVHGRRHGCTPRTVRSGRGGEEGVAIEFHEEFKADQAVSVDGIKVVKSAAQFPRISSGCVNTVLEEECDPRAVREEEGHVAFSASVEALRWRFCHQRAVSKVKDVGNDPIKGKVAAFVRGQACDNDALDHQLHIVVWHTQELVVNDRAGDGHRLVDGNRRRDVNRDKNGAVNFPQTGGVTREISHRPGKACLKDHRSERSVGRHRVNGREFPEFVGCCIGEPLATQPNLNGQVCQWIVNHVEQATLNGDGRVSVSIARGGQKQNLRRNADVEFHHSRTGLVVFGVVDIAVANRVNPLSSTSEFHRDLVWACSRVLW